MSAQHWGHWWLTLFSRFMKKGMRQQPTTQLRVEGECFKQQKTAFYKS